MKIALIDHNYPENTPFLLNKYKGLSTAIQVRLFHYGKPKSDGVIPQTSLIPHRIAQLMFFVRACCIQPIKMISWLYKAYRIEKIEGIKQVVIHYPLLRYQPDIIHFEFGTLAVNKMILKKLIHTKVIVSFRGYDLNYYKLLDATVYKEVWNEADAFHFLGNDLHQRAIRRGYQNDKLNFFIPPAIDIELFNPDPGHAKPNDGTIRIVSTGRLVWKKGYEYGIQAIRQLKQEGYKVDYTIIGDGPMKSALTFQIHQSELTDTVHLVGKKTQNEIKSYLQDADIFLHPAVSEGFCNAVIEAQAMGLPVVCTKADGLAENIVDGETGFVVPIYDYKSMAHSLIVLIKDVKLRNKMSINGQERANTLYRLEDQIQKYIFMYANLNV